MATARKTKAADKKPSGRHRTKPEPFSEALGARIKEFRLDRDISFDAVVGTSELGRGYVSELERGLAVPSVITLVRMANALEVSAIDLLNEVCQDRPHRADLINITARLSDEGLASLLLVAQNLLADEQSEE